MDPRPVRGCPPSLRPALLLAALAAVLLAPHASAIPTDPVHVPIAIVLEGDLPVGNYQVDYCAQDNTCVWAGTSSSSKACVGVTAGGLALEVDGGTGIYVQGGRGPGAYGGYSQRCFEHEETVHILDD